MARVAAAPEGDAVTPAVPEIALSAAWHEGRLPASLETVDGQTVEVVHRGTWSHGLGPDFADALLLFGGRELRAGGIELHLRTRGWTEHGHHLDPRYDTVVLHAVLRHDGSETRRRDGALVPVIEIGPLLELSPAAPVAVDWSRFGGAVCAPELSRRDPAAVRAILWELGDRRLAAKSARLEARLTAGPPADVLCAEVWDGLGFSANRDPMRALAALLPLAALEAVLAAAPPPERPAVARGLLFGAAGFLPLAPSDAALARLGPAAVAAAEAAWRRHGSPWHGAALPPTAWTRTRVRPANHPAARLATAATLLAAVQDRGGLQAALLAPLRAGTDPVATLRELASGGGAPGLGQERAVGITANALIPFALALAEQSGDRELADAAARAWERLPAAEPNEITRRAARQVAGESRLGTIGARDQQGLIQLDATLCAPRRCFECPIARRVASDGVASSSVIQRTTDGESSSPTTHLLTKQSSML